MTGLSVSTEDARHPLRGTDPGVIAAFGLFIAGPIVGGLLAGSDLIVAWTAGLCLATTREWRHM